MNIDDFDGDDDGGRDIGSMLNYVAAVLWSNDIAMRNEIPCTPLMLPELIPGDVSPMSLALTPRTPRTSYTPTPERSTSSQQMSPCTFFLKPPMSTPPPPPMTIHTSRQPLTCVCQCSQRTPRKHITLATKAPSNVQCPIIDARFLPNNTVYTNVEPRVFKTWASYDLPQFIPSLHTLVVETVAGHDSCLSWSAGARPSLEERFPMLEKFVIVGKATNNDQQILQTIAAHSQLKILCVALTGVLSNPIFIDTLSRVVSSLPALVELRVAFLNLNQSVARSMFAGVKTLIVGDTSFFDEECILV